MPGVEFPEGVPQQLKDAFDRFAESVEALNDALEDAEKTTGLEFCSKPFDVSVVVHVAIGCVHEGEHKYADLCRVHSSREMLKRHLRFQAERARIPAIVM